MAVTAITKHEAVQIAKKLDHELAESVQGYKQARDDFLLKLRKLRDTLIVGRRAYELLGYNTVGDYIEAFCARHGISASQTRRKLIAVRELPAATIETLGTEKSFVAARLQRAGKLTDTRVKELKEMKVDEARAYVSKMVDVVEGRRRISLIVAESQYDLWDAQYERYFKITRDESREGFFDFVLSQVTNMSDKEIAEEWHGRQEGYQ
jgi:hypothetical protein